MSSAAAAAQLSSKQVFDIIRGQEVNFPFPVNSDVFTVGTFDASTGRFTYLVDTYEEEFGPDPDVPGPLKPKTLRGGKFVALNVIEVILRFKVTHRTGTFTVSVAGLPPVSTSTADFVDISIGAADVVSFKISTGSRRFASELPLEIARFTAGAGVFEVPAFPVAIIYAPPVDQNKKNVSKWEVTKTTGNTTSFSIGKETSTTHPVTPDFDNVNLLATEINGAAQFLSELQNKLEAFKKFNDPVLEEVTKALKAVGGALGSSSATESQGVTITKDHSLTVSISNQRTISTDANSGGPGAGDLIFYIKNAKLAWFTQAVGRVRVTIFGHDGLGVTSVGFLKKGGKTDLEPALAAEFLKLDPFVAGGPSATLSPDRFVYLDTVDLNGGEITLVETHTVTREESTKTTRVNTHIQDNKPGLLHFLGLGVTDDTSTKTEISESSSTKSAETQTISNTVELFAGPDERYVVEVYCDVVFGTFAYRPATASATPLLQGAVRGTGAKAAAGKLVTLINDGRKFTTKTNSAGRYAFHAKTIRPGNSQIAVAGGVKQAVKLKAGANRHDIEL